MKVALVHDYLREYGGAERVVEVLHEMWPEAPLYTSFVDWEGLGRHAERFRNWDIRTSWVQGNPFVKRFISPLRFLAPRIWGSFDLSDYDVVISSSGWFMCRGVRTKKPLVVRCPSAFAQGKQLSEKTKLHNIQTDNRQPTTHNPIHICYIHHPPRNLYGYPTGSTLQKYAVVRAYAHVVNFFLRQYDYDTAQEVDYFIANSRETKRRVGKFYRRESTVIYPPITGKNLEFSIRNTETRKRERKQGVEYERSRVQNTKTSTDSGQARMTNVNTHPHSAFHIPHSYYLSVGRLAWAKRVDLAIAACNELALPLKVVGTGSEERALKALAGPTVEFLGAVSDGELSALYIGAKALIFCALDEDFGMVPVEAMAHGVPVIALGQGGVKETVIDGETGILFRKPEIPELVETLKKFEKGKNVYGSACVKQAENFLKKRFIREITAFVESKVQKRHLRVKH